MTSPKYAYWANTYIGGASGALDKVSQTNLQDDDIACIVSSTGSEVNFYWLDVDSGAAESSPHIIAPDDDTTGKRWIEVASLNQDLTTDSTGVIFDGLTIETGLLIGATGAPTTGEVIKISGASDREFWVDTTNADQLKKHQNLIFSADPGDTHASTVLAFNVDNTRVLEMDSNYHVKVPNNLIVGSTGTPSTEMEVVGTLTIASAAHTSRILDNSGTGNREILIIQAGQSSTGSASVYIYGDTDATFPGMFRITTNNTEAFAIDNSQNAKFPGTLLVGSTGTASTTFALVGIANAGSDVDKFMVWDTGGNVDYRTGTELLADISGDAGAAFDWNSQNLTSIGTIGCGAINAICHNNEIVCNNDTVIFN